MIDDNTINEAIEAIKESSEKSSIYVGCDSQIFRKKKNGPKRARYSTVIVIHMNSNNGCKIFHGSTMMEDFGNLKARLMNEVNFAVDAAMKIVDNLGGRKLEVHLDISEDDVNLSNVALREALGWVAGMGLDGKAKPEAFAATYAADYAVRNC